METLEQLKEIVKNAPEGATHYNKKGEYKYLKLTYFNGYQAFVNGESTINVMPNKLYGLRSLSDINRIIELTKENNELYEESAKDKGL